MQFTINVGTDYSTVIFHSWKVRPSAVESILNSLHKLGGKYLREQDHWLFSSFITSEILQEVIHNTCFECGGLMKDGQAIQEGKVFVSSYDSAVDTYQGEIEYPNPFSSKVIKVRKCSSCGHSHT